MERKPKGIVPAMITPFTEDQKLDLDGVRENVEFLIKAGVQGILICGSTGEAVALSDEERRKVLETAVNTARKRVFIVAGTGTPTTWKTIELTKQAKEAGANFALVITPFYCNPNKEGLYNHYEIIAKETELPIIAYNLPQATNVTIDVETLKRLVDNEYVVGIKDSSGDLSSHASMLHAVGDKISVFSGCDDQLLQSWVLGSVGAIIALGNIAPREAVQMFDFVQKGKFEKAREMYFRLLPVGRGIMVECNFPAIVKSAVKMLGRAAGPPRKPIIPLSKEEENELRAILEKAKLL